MNPSVMILPAIVFSALAFVAGCGKEGGSSAPASSTSSAPGGEMANTMMACAGIAGTTCANADEYCRLPDGACASVADASGICTKKPEVCTEMSAPVCGCDGKTYDNACKAAAAGVNVSAPGPCN